MFINWQQIKVQSPLRFDLGNFRSHRTTTELYSRFRVGPKRKFTTVNIKRTQHHCIFLYHVIYVHEGYKRWRTSFHSLFLWDTVTLSSGPASSLESDSTSKMVLSLTSTKFRKHKVSCESNPKNQYDKRWLNTLNWWSTLVTQKMSSVQGSWNF